MVQHWLRYWFDEKSDQQPPGMVRKKPWKKWEISTTNLPQLVTARRISGCHQEYWFDPSRAGARLRGFRGLDSPSFSLAFDGVFFSRNGNVEPWTMSHPGWCFFGIPTLAHHNPFKNWVVSAKFATFSATVQRTSTVGLAEKSWLPQDEFVEDEPIADVPFVFWHKDGKGMGTFPWSP